MNYSIIFYIIGWILNLEAAFMLPSCLVALIYQESSGWSLVAAVLLCLLIGLPLVIRKPKNRVFYLREGFATTALCWIVLSCVGALPFVLSGYIPNPVDALFETVSGFTTTGASILTDVEALPHCLLFWRSWEAERTFSRKASRSEMAKVLAARMVSRISSRSTLLRI